MRQRRRLREAAAGSSAGALLRGGSQSGDGDADDMPCPTCDGTGVKDGEVCSTCNGSGSVMREAAAPETKQCPTCDGEGKIRGGSVTCPDCHGTGKVPANFKESGFAADRRDLAGITEIAAAWNADGSLRESTVARLGEKDYSTEKRVELAKKGQAIPVRNDDGEITGGAYPIVDKGDLEDAVRSFGHSPTAETKAHIVKNAKRLGATSMLPEGWSGSTQKTSESGSLEERLAALEETLSSTAAKLTSIAEAGPADQLNTVFEPSTIKTNSAGEKGYEVTLIREGYGNQSDGNFYPGSAIKEMCESGRAEGMQAYADHPTLEEEETRPERSVRELIGRHTDVRYMEESGVPKAKSIFVPVTTNEQHPHYGWVNTLAEAAANSRSPQPLVGWSLYGQAAGDEAERPDGSTGRVVDLIMPSSGDMVTNAGAGGEFARRLMVESARRLRRAQPTHKEEPMKIGEFRTQMAEALKKLSEASSDEQRTAAQAEITRLSEEAAKIDTPPVTPETVEALQEANPTLVASLREAATAEAKTEVEGLREQLKEAQSKLGQANEIIGAVTDARQMGEALREAKVTDPDELAHFAGQARARGLTEKADIVAMVEAERKYTQKQQDAILAAVREAAGDIDLLPLVEGAGGREGSGSSSEDGGESFLRESGIPTKKKEAAAA